MLFKQPNDFNWVVDNFGATYTAAGLGTTVTANASANVKGSPATLIAAGSVTDDVYGVAIGFTRTNTAATAVGFLFDLLIDNAGGTSFSTLIANLLIHNPSMLRGGYWYYFPLYILAGSTIGGQVQASTGGSTVQALVKLYGKPSRPDSIDVGTAVQTFGVNTGTSRGTSITPGTNAMGSYTASLGTLSKDSFWFQCGMTSTDTTVGSTGYLFDVAVNATNKITVAENIMVNADSSENWGMANFGAGLPRQRISAGQDVYCRAAGIGTPDATISCAAYAVS